ncbi:hypothetical protein GCM10023318_41490 [Nocardia callitridis]|uniref:Uncharacterized protein n=1 Tax=Nocardia callitridis TaxID=648753 RepID=A0ABP9KJV3_9NOCA
MKYDLLGQPRAGGDGSVYPVYPVALDRVESDRVAALSTHALTQLSSRRAADRAARAAVLRSARGMAAGRTDLTHMFCPTEVVS